MSTSAPTSLRQWVASGLMSSLNDHRGGPKPLEPASLPRVTSGFVVVNHFSEMRSGVRAGRHRKVDFTQLARPRLLS